MKITVSHLNQKQIFQCKPEITLNFLKILIQDNFKDLPSDFTIQQSQSMRKMVDQKDLLEVITSNKLELAFSIQVSVPAEKEEMIDNSSERDFLKSEKKTVEVDAVTRIMECFSQITSEIDDQKKDKPQKDHDNFLQVFEILKEEYFTLRQLISKQITSKEELLQQEQYLANKGKEKLKNLNRMKRTLEKLLQQSSVQEKYLKSQKDLAKIQQQTSKQFQKQKKELIPKKSIELGEHECRAYSILKGIERYWENSKIHVSKEDKNTYKWSNLPEIIKSSCEHLMKIQSFKPQPQDRKQFQFWETKLTVIKSRGSFWEKTCALWNFYFQKWSNLIKHVRQFAKQLPQMCSLWNQIFQRVQNNSMTIEILCSEPWDKKIDLFCQKVEFLQKLINTFLEEKRMQFSRLHFLSQEKIIDIYCYPEPENVAKHFSNLFANTQQLLMGENQSIKGLISSEKEILYFQNEIKTENKAPDVWLREIEQKMKETIHQEINKTIQKGWKEELMKDLLHQTFLVCFHIDWTLKAEAAIQKKEMKIYAKQWRKELDQRIENMKKPMPDSDRKTLESLILMNAHTSDLSFSLGESVESIDDFIWVRMLKMFPGGDSCQLRCTDYAVPYFGEFLGNVYQRVITPLTHKGYITMMTAMKLGLGCAPSGLAGTGKTETVKNMARMCGQFCATIGCSDQFKYQVFAQILKAVAGTGIWCCFDEFNRVSIEVLSAVAIQLKSLLSARQNNKKTFSILSEEAPLVPTFNICITMNPGYAGRTQLPENIKSLFRTVYFMRPDYIVIFKGKMKSIGIQEADVLSKTLNSIFIIFNEQLSTYGHYDFGARKATNVINHMKILIQEYPDFSQTQLLALSIRKTVLPMLIPEDLPIFENIFTDYFPTFSQKKMNSASIEKFIAQSCKKLNLQDHPSFHEKVMELHDTLNIKHGVILVGPTGVGKTSIQKTLSSAIEYQNQVCVHKHIINPQSMKYDQVYGHAEGQGWRDGILTSAFRKSNEDKTNDINWIKFDGPINAIWVEWMNPALDDCKFLPLPNKDKVMIRPKTKLLFETRDTDVCSPAFISRCAVIHFGENIFDISFVIESWTSSLPQEISSREKTVETIKKLVKEFLPESHEFLMKNCDLILSQANLPHFVQSFLKLLKCQLIYSIENGLLNNLEQCLMEVIGWCLIWSFGCLTNFEGRNKFSEFLKKICGDKMKEVESNIFDMNFCLEEKKWINWEKITMQESEFDSQVPPLNMIVPTSQMRRISSVMKLLISEKHPVLLAGPRCTGKTVTLHQTMQALPATSYKWKVLSCNPFTSVSEPRMILEKGLQKRKSQTFGPQKGKEYIICIDDMNLVRRGVYGDQPLLEWVRTFTDNHFWYDFQSLQKVSCEDTFTVGTITSTSFNGCSRVLSKFNVISCHQTQNTTASSIFTTITGYWMKNIPQSISSLSRQFTEAISKMYNFNKEYPTKVPTSLSAEFILRDTLKVIQGICSVDSSVLKTPSDLMKLYQHENMRVFQDRLCPDDRKNYFLKSTEIIKSCFKQESSLSENTIFYDALSEDSEQFLESIKSYLQRIQTDEINSLMLTSDGCKQIAKICRILRQVRGHCLLLGSRGSGGRQYSKVASFLLNGNMREVIIGHNFTKMQWNNFMKDLIYDAVEANQKYHVIFSESQFPTQIFCSLVEAMKGENYESYLTERDLKYLANCCRQQCEKKGVPTKVQNLEKLRKERVLNNINYIVCTDPNDEKFQNCLREFPEILRETSVNWLSISCQQSLVKIAKKYLSEKVLDTNSTEACMKVHECFEKERQKFTASEYLPISYENYYFQFLDTFKNEYQKSQHELNSVTEYFSMKITKLQAYIKHISELKGQNTEKMFQKLQEIKAVYEKKIKNSEESRQMILGNGILKAANIVYCPGMNYECRKKMRGLWDEILLNQKVLYSCDQKSKIQQCSDLDWCEDGLFKENILIMREKMQKLPLFVDPERQMKKNFSMMIQNKGEQLSVISVSDTGLLTKISSALCQGNWVLVEGVTSNIPNELLKTYYNTSKTKKSKIVFLTYEYNTSLTSQMNQIYLLNCSITPYTLQNQLLRQIIRGSYSEMDNQKIKAQVEYTQLMIGAKEKEEALLNYSIESTTTNDKFMDELMGLHNHFQKIHQISETYQTLSSQEKELSEKFLPCASYASVLYSCVRDLASINSIYYMGLDDFIGLFVKCLSKEISEVSIAEKMNNINKHFAIQLYRTVIKQIYSQHRLLFSFILVCKIMENSFIIKKEEISFFATWANDNLSVPVNPTSWIPAGRWVCTYTEIKRLSGLDHFHKIDSHLMENHNEWRKMFLGSIFDNFPQPFDSLNNFQKLMVIKVLFPENLQKCMQEYVKTNLGAQFCEGVRNDFTNIYQESSSSCALLVVKKIGNNEEFSAEMEKYAKQNNMADNIQIMYLTQESEEKFLQKLKKDSQQKKWLVVQDCQFFRNFFSQLWATWKDLRQKCHTDFRLWLVFAPITQLPLDFLESCKKMVWQIPISCRNLLKSIYTPELQSEFEECKQPQKFRQLFFSFCIFHCIVLGRNKYYGIGWKLHYDISLHDLLSIKREIKITLNQQPKVDFKRLHYMAYQIYYSRIWEDRDHTLLTLLSEAFANQKALAPSFSFTKTGNFTQPKEFTFKAYLEMIEGLPEITQVDLGLPESASSVHNINYCYDLVKNLNGMTILRNPPTTKEKLSVVEAYLCMIPEKIDIFDVKRRCPVSYQCSMNSCLLQECNTYNRLTNQIKEELLLMKKYLSKEAFAPNRTISMINDIYENRLPESWKRFNRTLPLNEWIDNLQKRVEYFRKWVEMGTSVCFDLSMFLKPESVFSACLQNFSRKYAIYIELLTLTCKFVNIEPNAIKEAPADGCYISGIYIEGASYDSELNKLIEQKKGKIHEKLPVIHLCPQRKNITQEEPVFSCPLYRLIPRRGTFDVSRVRTYIMDISLPVKTTKEQCIRNLLMAFISS